MEEDNENNKSNKQYNIQLNDRSINKIYRLSNNTKNNMFINFSKNIFTFNNNSIRFFYYDNQIFFKAEDIAKILNYDNTINAVQINVNSNDKFKICDIFKEQLQNNLTQSVPFLQDDLDTIFINEFGLYSLIISSSLSEHETQYFKRWIISNIFPAIRKNGSYNIINNYIDENLDKYYKKDCVYIINIVDNIYKYGYSSNIAKRLQHHNNTLNYNKIIKIYEMKSINQTIELEKKIKKLVYSLNINRVLTNENSKYTHTEIFEIDNDNLYNIVEKINEFFDEILNNNN